MIGLTGWIVMGLLLSAGGPEAQSPGERLQSPAVLEASFDAVPLRYPPVQQRNGTGGTTVVQVSVAASGEASAVSVRLSSGNRSLDRAAIDYAGRLRFESARRDGQPVEGTLLLPVNFTPLDTAVADGTRTPTVRPELRRDFECTSSVGESELAICGQGGLRNAEAEVGQVYGLALARGADADLRSLVLDGHRTWLADRNRRCRADAACLVTDSRDRARYVRALAGIAP